MKNYLHLKSVCSLLVVLWVCLFSVNVLSAQEQPFIYEGKTYYPFPTEASTFTGESAATSTQLKYDFATQEMSVLPAQAQVENSTTRLANKPQQESLRKYLERGNLNKNFSDPELEPFENATADGSPSSYSVKLLITYPSGNRYVCSGSMLSGSHVLTSGRCVFWAEEGGMATEILAIPSFFNGFELLGRATARASYTWTEWSNNGDPGWNMGQIYLDKPLGLFLRHLNPNDPNAFVGGGFIFFNPDTSADIFTDGGFGMHSYPSVDPFSGIELYSRFGNFDNADDENIASYDNITYPGEEGAVVYGVSGDGFPIVVGVVSEVGEATTDCVKTNEERTDDIIEHLIDDNVSTSDITPLLVTTDVADVTAGGRTGDIEVLIYNVGSLSATGRVRMDVYLSTNEIITEADIKLGSESANTTIGSESFEFLDIGKSNIPADIVDGEYFIGVIITSDTKYEPNNASGGFFLSSTINITGGAAPFINVDPTAIQLDAPAGSTSVTVDANIDWSATIDVDWISGLIDGNQINMDYEENTTGAVRSATLTISGDGIVQEVLIRQSAAAVEEVLAVNPQFLQYDAAGGDQNVDINSNLDYTITTDASWLTLGATSGSGNQSLNVTAATNPTTTARTGTITIAGGSLNQVIQVSQDGAAVILAASPTFITLAATMDDAAININSNVDYSITSSEEWLTLSATSGSGNMSLVVTASENTSTDARTAVVTISGSGVTETIQVNQDGQAAFLTVNPSSLTYDAAGGSADVSVSTNVEYTATTTAGWLTITLNDDNTFTVVASENTGTTERTGTITVTGGGVTQTIQVTQAGAAVILAASPTFITIDAAGGNADVNITSNVDYSISSNQEWLSLSTTSGSGNLTLNVTASENPTTDTRTAVITVSGSGVSETIQVNQDGQALFLTASPNSLNYDAAGGNADVNVNSNVDYTVSTSAAWITVSAEAGSGSGTFTVTAAENTSTDSRSGAVTVTGGGMTQTIQVNQDGQALMLTVNPTFINFDTPGGSADVSVSANIDYTISEDADWVTVSAEAGSGSGTFTVTASENTAIDSRTATVTITGSGLTQTVQITQSGVAPVLTVSPQQLDFEAVGGSADVNVNANVTYTISEDADWVTVSAEGGDASQTFTVTAAENTGGARSATITVTGSGMTQTVTVNQAAFIANLTVNPSSLSYEAVGGSADVSVNANVDYNVSTDAMWITLSAEAGSGSGTFTATAAENTATVERSGTITVTGGGITQTIQVTQAAAGVVLGVSPQQLDFDAAGGNADVNVNSNISYSISEDADWVLVSTEGGNGNSTFTVTALENTSTMSRSATITISGSGATQVVTVNQAAAGVILEVNPQSLNYAAAGGSMDATVTANVIYSVSTDAAWLTITQEADSDTFTATAAENTSTASRSTTIEVTSGDGTTRTIQVTQAGADAILVANPTSIDFAIAGGNADVNITSNTSYSISTDAEWLTLSSTGGEGNQTFTVTAAENSGDDRTATITVTGSGITQTIAVNQAGFVAVLTVSPASLNFEAAGGNADVNVNANVDWTISNDIDWITVGPMNGSGMGTVTVTASENANTTARSGSFTINGGGISTTVMVSQNPAGTFVSVSPTTLNLGAAGDCTQITISSNTSWSVSTDAEWITSIEPASGSGTMDVTICYADNESTDDRTGAVTVSSDDLDDQNVTVNQAGAALFVDANPQTIQVPATAGTATFDITSNTSYTISTDASWLSLSTDAGEGNMEVSVDYESNLVTEGRTGVISITTETETITVMVIQVASIAFGNVAQTEYGVEAAEGCVEIELTTNSDWTATSDNPMITSIEPASGSGDATITVCYSANTDVDPRLGTVIIDIVDADPITVNIGQAGMMVGLEDVNGNEITVTTFPNPATELVTWAFSAPVNEDVTMEIINVNGQVMTVDYNTLSRGATQLSVDVKNYAAGTYFFRLIGAEGAVSGRFMVIK